MKRTALNKLERNFIISGIFITLFLMGLIYGCVKYLYHFELSYTVYILGYFYVLLFYFYLFRNYELGKAKKQQKVAYYSLAGASINLIISIMLIPTFKLEGALTGGLISQVFLVIIFNRNMFSLSKRSA